MENHKEIAYKIIMDYCPSMNHDPIEYMIEVNDLNYKALRDRMYSVGDVIFSDDDSKVVCVAIKGGTLDKNTAYAVFFVGDLSIEFFVYAHEGVLNQGTERKVFDRIKDGLSEYIIEKNYDINGNNKKKSKRGKGVIIGIITILLVVAIWYVCDRKGSVDEYNGVVDDYNELVSKYDDLILISSIDNLDGFPQKHYKKEHIDNTFSKSLNISENWSEKCEEAKNDLSQLLAEYMVVAQITNPDESFVIERLKEISDVSGCMAASQGKDPNNALGQPGGYTSDVYFSLNKIDQTSVQGSDIVEKGTDCGGSIEVYSNKEDAEKRCDYLKEFDGTYLYSGSYTLIGTMVIRVSYKLTDDEQLNLTERIIDRFIEIDESRMQ